jgi:NAD(P)-dependent dehydrogenase (short-subunit alcohol dehydrogenase family)
MNKDRQATESPRDSKTGYPQQRPPCRGCSSACSCYDRCENKPWRDENRSGGWHAYRASKSALNMLFKTAAIECARRAGNVKLIAFHPGTTDAALSRPFHASVPKDALFSPRFLASHLVDIMKQQHIDGELSFVDWKNESIIW